MADDVDTKKQLFGLFDKNQSSFSRRLGKRINARDWATILKLNRASRQISVIDGHSLSDEAIQLYVAGAVDGVISFIETIDNSSSVLNSSSEISTLKKRLDRIESELLKMLPPDFENPSSEEPFSN